jgi:deoxyribodipyrimidine photo-lyase
MDKQNITKPSINIVWIKRDIRSQDHAALKVAEENELPYLSIFIFEPSIISYPDTSLRHLQFQFKSLEAVNKKLIPHNKGIHIFYAEAVDVFLSLINQFHIHHVFSYQESGIQLTFERDILMKQLFKSSNIIWQEFQRDGIVRGLMNRTHWDELWHHAMTQHIKVIKYDIQIAISFNNIYLIPIGLQQQWQDYPKSFQPAGEQFAFQYLQSFLNDRGKNYSRHISKPLFSRKSCARLSPYLAWGNISIRQVYQLTQIQLHLSKINHRPLRNFLSRLHWHCHFIQKFEMECSYEYACVNKGYELIEHPENKDWIKAWETGNTGIPLVDANMRCLQATGWINFRMRALLVSFFTHHLFQDWRKGVYHLAQLFLDYEPGIHYPQWQMQAGTTGTNLVRVYNPIKNSIEHDTDASFIKSWIPALSNLPSAYAHQPWLMTAMDCVMYRFEKGKDYPNPIIDLNQDIKKHKDIIWNMRSHELVKTENKRILATHVRKKKKE